ncbi:MAG: hypothetical protein C0597_02010 [Marinilabiliales bacterium]|nr:MAG: hypothetical protein C0597_02010 [Marinilabiliales bacterium]
MKNKRHITCVTNNRFFIEMNIKVSEKYKLHNTIESSEFNLNLKNCLRKQLEEEKAIFLSNFIITALIAFILLLPNN